MAIIQPTVTAIGRGNGGTLLITWTPVTENDSCAPVMYPEMTDRSMHVWGTFGGASVAFQGSNNGGASFVALSDPSGTTIAITGEGIKAVLANTQQFKPVASGGTGQSLSIAILAHLSNPLRTS